MHHSARKFQPPSHAAGICPDEVVCALFKIHKRKHFFDALFPDVFRNFRTGARASQDFPCLSKGHQRLAAERLCRLISDFFLLADNVKAVYQSRA